MMPKPEWSMRPDPKPTREARPKQRAMRRRAVKPESVKRADERAVYNDFRRHLLATVHYECQANVEGVCTGQATQVHHRRGRVGADYLRASLFLPVCMECHEWIEHNPDEAVQLGLSERRNQP